MNSNSVKLAVLALALVALASFWVTRDDPKGGTQRVEGRTPSSLESPASPAQAPLATAPPPRSRAAQGVRREREPLSQAEREHALVDKLRRMDESLLMEPVSPGWAAAANKQISSALQAQNLKALGAEPPDFYEAECRSSSCKLSLMFADASNAEDTILALTTEIAAMFPEAVVVPVRGGDGTAQYFVYASTRKGSKLLGGS